MAKRSIHEQQKYLPSYDCTMFKPCTVEALFLNNNIYNSNQASTDASAENSTNATNNSNFNSNGSAMNGSNNNDSPNASNSDNQTDLNMNAGLFGQDEDCKSNVFMQNQLNSNVDSSDSSNSNNNANCTQSLNSSLANMINLGNFCASSCASPFNQMNNIFGQNSNLFANTPLPANLDSQRGVRDWLMANRFEKYFSMFQMFNSKDLLNLSREDLIQICGLTDGIRLYNCLHIKVSQPKIPIYLSFESGLFRAAYLSTFKLDEFREKLLRMVYENGGNYDYNVLSSKLKQILMIGPNQIKFLVTEDVISNLAKESMYIIQIEQGKEAY